MYKERSTRRWKLCQVGDERARVEESSWRDKHVNTVVRDGISEFKFAGLRQRVKSSVYDRVNNVS